MSTKTSGSWLGSRPSRCPLSSLLAPRVLRGEPEPLDLRPLPLRRLVEPDVRRERCVGIIAPSDASQLQAVPSPCLQNADARTHTKALGGDSQPWSLMTLTI